MTRGWVVLLTTFEIQPKAQSLVAQGPGATRTPPFSGRNTKGASRPVKNRGWGKDLS